MCSAQYAFIRVTDVDDMFHYLTFTQSRIDATLEESVIKASQKPSWKSINYLAVKKEKKKIVRKQMLVKTLKKTRRKTFENEIIIVTAWAASPFSCPFLHYRVSVCRKIWNWQNIKMSASNIRVSRQSIYLIEKNFPQNLFTLILFYSMHSIEIKWN